MNTAIVSNNPQKTNIELKFTANGRLRKETGKALKNAGLRYCARCQTVKRISEFPNNYSRCIKCKRNSVRGRDSSAWLAHRKNIKMQLMEEIGGARCARCGFSEVPDALDFHHLNGDLKSDSISRMLNTRTCIDKIRKEARKCIVLCSNCHRGVHAGIYILFPGQLELFL